MTKTALIIGAQDYDPRDGLTPLSCARNDALALGRVLREQCGFGDVRVLAGEGIADSDGRPTKSAIRREINRLRESPKRIELLVVAFCAHGLTLPVGGADRYYLLPEDAHQHEPDSFLEFADLMRRLNEIPANDRAVIFDTCRNRPEAGRASGDNLLARDLSIELLTRPEDEREGTTAVLTACSLGERAYEMQDAGHGVFFHFLLEGMKGPAWTEQGALSLNDAFGYAERQIAARPVFRQRPTFEQKGGGVILLGQREELSASADAKAGQPRPNPEALADALDLAFWQSVQNSTVAAEFEAYLREFPTGRFVTLARQRLEALRPSVPLGQPSDERPTNSSTPPGTFTPSDEKKEGRGTSVLSLSGKPEEVFSFKSNWELLGKFFGEIRNLPKFFWKSFVMNPIILAMVGLIHYYTGDHRSSAFLNFIKTYDELWFLYRIDVYLMLTFIIIIFANIRTTIHAFLGSAADLGSADDKAPIYSKRVYSKEDMTCDGRFFKLLLDFLAFCPVLVFVVAIWFVYMLWYDCFLNPYDKFFQSATYARQALITNWAQVFFITVPVFVFSSVAFGISSIFFVSVIINNNFSIRDFVWDCWGNKRAISCLFLLMINPMLIVIFVAALFFWGLIVPADVASDLYKHLINGYEFNFKMHLYLDSRWAEFLLLYPITHFLINFFSIMISFIFLRIFIYIRKNRKGLWS
jgi:uncharacterized caspase-like protein